MEDTDANKKREAEQPRETIDETIRKAFEEGARERLGDRYKEAFGPDGNYILPDGTQLIEGDIAIPPPKEKRSVRE